MWDAITDRLNDETSVKFQVKKKNVQEHFKLLLDKFKAKRKHQAKLSGVDIEDSEMDILMEEILEKWEEPVTVVALAMKSLIQIERLVKK